MTAVEWLASKLSITYNTMYADEIAQALEMEKQQIHKGGELETFEDHFSDIGKMVELSDDEILKAAKECRFLDWDNSVGSFELGAQWYREQLKQKL